MKPLKNRPRKILFYAFFTKPPIFDLMQIVDGLSGFTYIRNGIQLGYPFLAAINCLASICSEVVVVVGDSTDGTRDAIEKLGHQKLKIIDTVWDMNRRNGGKVFADQCNAGLDEVGGRWVLHLQADEVLHEDHLSLIGQSVEQYEADELTEAFILPFMHFWGGYQYIRTSRRMHRYEIRLMRRQPGIRSYADSQGFRVYPSDEAYEQGHKGRKMRVRKLEAPVFHYNHVRPQQVQQQKLHTFDAMHSNDHQAPASAYDHFDYNRVDRLVPLQGTHPVFMHSFIANTPVTFDYDPSKAHWEKFDRYLQPAEDLLGIRIGEYKNYKLL